MLPLRKWTIYPLLCRPLSFKRIEQMTSTWAHFKGQTQLFKMSLSWGHQLNLFRSNSLPKSILLLRKSRINPSLCRPLTFKRIELMTSTWAHFDEQAQLSKNDSSWGLQLNLFRSNRFPRWMLLLGMKAFPLNFCWLPKSLAGGQGQW